MRKLLKETEEQERLKLIFGEYLKKNDENKNYIPDDAPEEAKAAFAEWKRIDKIERDKFSDKWGWKIVD